MSAQQTLSGLNALLGELSGVYEDLHAHPELSYQERRTSGIISRQLDQLGYEVHTDVGTTGVVGLLRNGDGPTVLLRADMDALPVREQTGLDYASTVTATNNRGEEVPVMHACGHDMHVTWLLGAAQLLSAATDSWSGTLMLVFQPAEEAGQGAESMIDDRFFERFGTPDIAFGQHVGPVPAGKVLYRAGLALSATDSLHVRLHGRGGHGSQPENTVDPIVLASAIVTRLQTVVSRRVAASESAVVTVGSLHAGSAPNIIPAHADMEINIRSQSEEVRSRLLEEVERIVRGEAQAAGAPKDPEITDITRFPTTVNDEDATARLVTALTEEFGEERVVEGPVMMGSEDFGVFGTRAGCPSVFWFVGGTDPQAYTEAETRGTKNEDISSNHSPFFAPVQNPTLETGVRALVTAAMSRLGT